MVKKCKKCGKEFETNLKEKKYCSVECRAKYWLENNKERIKFKCECCRKIFGRPRRINAKGKKIRYCSRECANKSSRTPLIKQKTRQGKQGYISIWKPEHPNNVNGRIKEHVLVMEKKIGRYIEEGEIVHHINYLEDDNREENLFLCNTYKEHDKIHRKSRYLIKEFIKEKGLSEELTEYMTKNCSDLRTDKKEEKKE